MRPYLSFLFLLLTSISSGQTKDHKAVAGTKISLIPPKGFVAATSFSGFQNGEEGASIIILEIPGPYASVVSGFTADKLSVKGMTLIDKQIIDLNKAKATLAKVSQKQNGVVYLKQILIFGDSLNTIMVNGMYPEENKGIEGPIKTSLLSAFYNKDQKENAEENASFKIDVSGSPLSFAKAMGGSLVYTVGGKIPMVSADRAILSVGNSMSTAVVEDKKEFSVNQMRGLTGGETIEIKETNAVTIDGMECYETTGFKEDVAGNKQLIYFLMLFAKDNQSYVLFGSTIADHDAYLATFKKIARTFKRR
jgi:hypothetical protein